MENMHIQGRIKEYYITILRQVFLKMSWCYIYIDILIGHWAHLVNTKDYELIGDQDVASY